MIWGAGAGGLAQFPGPGNNLFKAVAGNLFKAVAATFGPKK